MATLVLSVAGAVIGGPLGGAIGAAIGQQLDRAILTPGSRREGPRLKQLDVQTSSYGTQIPAVFGVMRVAGTVIWASDLIERRMKSGGGKGRPSSIDYSYSVNMAVALSSRLVSHVGRIWAEGNLLRGAAGDFKVETGFRFYNGHGDQSCDHLIASAEGSANCPAYRGIAYALFEQLQLADYGNRIPSLTFEIFERDGKVRLVDIAAAASDGLIDGESGEAVEGYALSGSDVRGAIAPLFDSLPVLVRAFDQHLDVANWFDTTVATPVIEAVQSGASALDRAGQQLQPAGDAPHALSVRHYEPARDYQTGIQRVQRSGAAGLEKLIDLPAAVDASTARRFADLRLHQLQRSRSTLSGHFLPTARRLRPGDWILHGEDTQAWRIAEIEHMRGVQKIRASRSLAGQIALADASPGRSIRAPDLTAGETRLALIDLPALGLTESISPVVGVFAAGTESGWRRAALSVHQGEQLIEIGGTATRANIGRTLNALPAQGPYLIDNRNTLEVQMLNSAMLLPPGDGSPTNATAPTCFVGGEYIRYGSAEYLGAGAYLLSGLLRGCFDSEDKISSHAIGEQFVIVEADRVLLIDSSLLSVGRSCIVEALGVGDSEAVESDILVAGNAIRPLSPVHLDVAWTTDGGLTIDWIRRSRLNTGWQNGTDLPLGEDIESYLVEITVGATSLGSWNVAQGKLTVPVDIVAGWGPSEDTLINVSVRQIGSFALSEPTNLIVTI